DCPQCILINLKEGRVAQIWSVLRAVETHLDMFGVIDARQNFRSTALRIKSAGQDRIATAYRDAEQVGSSHPAMVAIWGLHALEIRQSPGGQGEHPGECENRQ